MDRQFTHTFLADGISCDRWQMHERGSFTSKNDVLTVSDGWASAADLSFSDCILDFSARAPREAPQVQIWAGFRHYSQDYRYVAALRGGSNNHLYLARLGAEGYDKMLALRPLEWSPMPGVWYNLRIVCSGKTIAVYVNDFERPLICVQDEDAPFTEGSISLGGSYVPTEFKDIEVTRIDKHYLDSVHPLPAYLESVTLSDSEKQKQRFRERAAYRSYAIPSASMGRTTLSLDGKWLFIPDYEVTAEPTALCYDDSNAHVVSVPSSWIPLQAWLEGENMGDMNKGMNDDYLVEEMTRCLNQTFDYAKTLSAWYRHYLDLPKGIKDKRVVLDFEGIALISTIYFNGVRVHENIGMFTPMQIDVSDYVQEGRNVIAIEVHRCLPEESTHTVNPSSVENNYVKAWDILDESEKEDETAFSQWEHREFCTDDIPHGFYMNHPGGIWRSVHLIISDKVHVEESFFVPTLTDASIEVKYQNSSAQEQDITLSYSLVHKTTGEYLCGGDIERKILAAGEECTAAFQTPCVSPRLWGPGTPNLYTLTFTLTQNGNVLDVYQENVGFRTVAFDGQTLLYNGNPLWVRGGNHMPAHVKPNDRNLAKKFMSLALAHNCIATRTHVAPWTSAWLDSADEAGLMISFEGTWTWLMLEHIPSRKSIHIWKAELEKLLKRHRNRPSLFLMTMNNEMKFYLHEAPDEVVAEKGHLLEGGMELVRKTMPHLPVVCDSAYYRKHAIRSGRYERIITANGYDDGDMDDPHGYFGWYNPDFFHFMNGEFGEEYALEGRPCMSQECATGYPRAQDGLPTRFYLFQHQTPQTTVGKKAYEHCDPAYFLGRHAMLTKELVEMFRRVEHDRTCGVLLFAFETWFYHQHDSSRIQPMQSARSLKIAYQPVLVSAELWGRHFFAGDTIRTNVTLINDSCPTRTLHAPTIEAVIAAGDAVLSSAALPCSSLAYFRTQTQPLALKLPDTLAANRVEARLILKVLEDGHVISQNEYDILLGTKEWAMGNGYADTCYYLEGDKTAQSLLNYYQIASKSCDASDLLSGLTDGSDTSPAISGRLIACGSVTEECAGKIHAFAKAGGHVILLGQKELPKALLGGMEAPFTEHRQEIVTMNVPESSTFDGIEPLDISWFEDGRKVPYAAAGRYSVDRFDPDVHVLAETLEWHGYISKPTDYKALGGTPLFSTKVGGGNILVSALRTDAAYSDPVASRLTGNLIGWDFDQN